MLLSDEIEFEYIHDKHLVIFVYKITTYMYLNLI